MEHEDAAELVARLRARLAEHEGSLRGRAGGFERARRLFPSWRPPSRRRVELLVGAAALAIAIGGAVLAFGAPAPQARPHASARAATVTRVRSAASVTTATTATTAGVTARPPRVDAALAADLLPRLPSSWRPTCRVAPSAHGRPPSALTCAPVAGTTVEVRRVRPAAADRILARMVPAGARNIAGLACAKGAGAPRTWSSNTRPDVAAGFVVCFGTARGAQLVWSLDHEGLVMRAIRVDADAPRLFAWWVGTTF